MSSDSSSRQNPSPPPPLQSRSIGESARVEVEERSRRMRLLFGEDQIVFLRPDGLRSRVVRSNLKRKREMNQEKEPEEPAESETLTQVIDDVARNSEGSGSSEPSTSSSEGPSTSADVNGTSNSNNSAKTEQWKSMMENQKGNRSYHPPKKFNGASTMVTHKKRWTYQTACDINAAEQSGDGQMYYIAHPFLPLPRGRRNEISTATRMNYAAQRLDNRKFRGQTEAVQKIADNESVTCEKCGMRYFFESLRMQERISYLESANEEHLPTVLFDCPVCKTTTRVFS